MITQENDESVSKKQKSDQKWLIFLDKVYTGVQYFFTIQNTTF